MEVICEKEKCVGCGACFNACPFDAIDMRDDEFGVLYPYIKQDKCKDCKQCIKVCPAINYMECNMPRKCYAAYTKHQTDRVDCASGGIATTLGKYITKNGGVVFGTTFKKSPMFSYAKKTEEVDNFKGSKYVYVFPDKIYSQIKDKLSQGKKCLFVGTPCQVAGLKAYLKRDYENLVTVDLICHGVPSFSYLNEWLSYKLKKDFASVVFRGKKNYYLTCLDEDNKIIYSKKHDEDEYFCAFLLGIIHRENCYSCMYAKKERVSDITIGDFWGLDSNALGGYKGRRSVILVNTDKGERIFEETKMLFEYEESDFEEAVRGNDQLTFPTPKHVLRNKFLEGYQKNGFCGAVKSCGLSKYVLKNRCKNHILYLPRRIKNFFR